MVIVIAQCPKNNAQSVPSSQAESVPQSNPYSLYSFQMMPSGMLYTLKSLS